MLYLFLSAVSHLLKCNKSLRLCSLSPCETPSTIQSYRLEETMGGLYSASHPKQGQLSIQGRLLRAIQSGLETFRDTDLSVYGLPIPLRNYPHHECYFLSISSLRVSCFCFCPLLLALLLCTTVKSLAASAWRPPISDRAAVTCRWSHDFS